MAFLALNHGADGIIYFSYKSGDRPITEHTELFAEISRLNGQLRALRGALLVKPIEGAMQLHLLSDERSQAPDNEKSAEGSTPLDCSLRRFRSALLFIAVNPDPWSKTVNVTFSESSADAQAFELFTEGDSEPMTIPAERTLALAFDAYQVRLFWIQ